MARLGLFVYRLLGAIGVWPLAFFLKDHPNFKGTLAQRFGFVLPDAPFGRKTIWIHAASVGEVKAVSGLIRAIRKKSPGVFIFLSSMTATGRDVAREMPELNLVFPFPFDLSWIMKRYLLRLGPSAVLVVETEIWPDMILSARQLAIPVMFVNARMSERAYERYMKFVTVLRSILTGVKVFAIAEEDASRFRSIGAADVQVLGNLKLDQVAAGDKARSDKVHLDKLRQELGIGDRPVFIAGSVREDEEKEVVDAIIRIATKIPSLYSIIAPRHPDRIDLIKNMAQGLNINWGLRSTGATGIDLLIVDTMGELFTFYGVSDVAFVGGSLANLGGQNILEPIAWGVPTIHGTHMENFSWALNAVKGYTLMVNNSIELAGAVVDILQNGRFSELGMKAKDALQSKSGVTQRYLNEISPYL
jgi:3-deoxy-D-manno-octulosonic-acid transferase